MKCSEGGQCKEKLPESKRIALFCPKKHVSLSQDALRGAHIAEVLNPEPLDENNYMDMSYDVQCQLHALSVHLYNLILESRFPFPNDKGYGEGPHCPPMYGPHDHLCNLTIPECKQYQAVLERLLCCETYPCFEIEVILLPKCCQRDRDWIFPETVEKTYVLLERWKMSYNYVSSSKVVMDERQLLRAVHSFLHFSQLSAWLSLYKGKLPNNIFYWVKLPTDTFITKFDSVPETHIFPPAQITDNAISSVSVTFRQRTSSVPIIPCAKQDCQLHAMSVSASNKSEPKFESVSCENARNIGISLLLNRTSANDFGESSGSSHCIGDEVQKYEKKESHSCSSTAKIESQVSGFKDAVQSLLSMNCSKPAFNRKCVKRKSNCVQEKIKIKILSCDNSKCVAVGYSSITSQPLSDAGLPLLQDYEEKTAFVKNINSSRVVPKSRQFINKTGQNEKKMEIDNRNEQKCETKEITPPSIAINMPLTTGMDVFQAHEESVPFLNNVENLSETSRSFSNVQNFKESNKVPMSWNSEPFASTIRRFPEGPWDKTFGTRKLPQRLLVNFEESILHDCLQPVRAVPGFKVAIAASGSFTPGHITLPVDVLFYELDGFLKGALPYVGNVCLTGVNYYVPKKGSLQVTLFNPLGTVVKMFIVNYDLHMLPPLGHTFVRQRTFCVPIDTDISNPPRKWLRYIINLRFALSKTGRLYLNEGIKMIVMSNNNCDVATHEQNHQLLSFNEVAPFSSTFS